MKKWTTTLNAMAPPQPISSSVSLQSVLDTRRGPLNEVEAWAVMAQTAHALQDTLLRINGRMYHGIGSDGASRADSVLVLPHRLMFTLSGRVYMSADNASDEAVKHEYQRPDLRDKMNLTEQELEAIGVFSLGRTVASSLYHTARQHQQEVSPQLSDLLTEMTSLSSMTLLRLLEKISEQWQRMVGSSPISRFISQLCRVTSALRGKTMHHSYSSVALTNHDSRSDVILSSGCFADNANEQLQLHSSRIEETSLVPKKAQIEELIEFSRLETSSSSEASSPSSPGCQHVQMDQDLNQLLANSCGDDVDGRQQQLRQEPSLKRDREEEEGEETKGEIGIDSAAAAAAAADKSGSSSNNCYENIRFSSSSSVNTIGSYDHECLPLESSSLQQHPRRYTSSGGALNGQIHHHIQSTNAAQISHQSRRLSSVSSRKSNNNNSNPSRLYRVVRPLADVAPAPSPATKRCVGPEFVVMAAEARHAVVDLAHRLTSSKAVGINTVRQVKYDL